MLDEARSALSLARSLGWIARDRVLADWIERRDGIPAGPEAITADWLSQALGESQPGARVETVTLCGGHSGTTTRERIAVRYAADGRPAGLPERLFVKITPRHLGTRLFGGVLDLGSSEVRFYRLIRDALGIPAPIAYAARAATRGGRFVLVLEDLAARGCEFPPESLGVEHARGVMRTLGRLHAAFWRSPRLAGDLDWMRSHRNRPTAAIERVISARAQQPSIRRHADLLSESVRARSGQVHRHRELLERYWSQGPLTIIHGDAHMGNLYFDRGEAGLLDWQVVQQGQGIRDVAYFMTNSLETELRRKHETELFDLYLETLAESGVAAEDLDRERIWERYRSQILYAWISACVTAATPGLQPEFVGRAALQRTGLALDDHASLELLDELVAREAQ